MRIPRIFQAQDLYVGANLDLDERAFKHLVQVLRFSEGRELILFNGQGGEYHAKLHAVSKRSAQATIFSFDDISRESALDIHLAQCISKGDRFDFAIQKAVELGVKSITPVISARSQLKLNEERREKKISHWQQVAISACEQSGRTRCIDIHEPLALADYLPQAQAQTRLILHPESSRKLTEIKLGTSFDVLIGPEGGFEDKELVLASRAQFESIQLGTRILRTETAPITIIAALHALSGNF